MSCLRKRPVHMKISTFFFKEQMSQEIVNDFEKDMSDPEPDEQISELERMLNYTSAQPPTTELPAPEKTSAQPLTSEPPAPKKTSPIRISTHLHQKPQRQQPITKQNGQ